MSAPPDAAKAVRPPTTLGALVRWTISIGALALASCLGIDPFFFAARRVDGYRFDEPDPELDGDLSAPHASLVPASLREEGFARTTRGDDVHWVLARQPAGRARTTLLFSHGNGPHLGRSWDRVEVLWQLGYQVLAYDYPGFGRSTGEPSEAGLYEAAEAALAVLLARPDVDAARVVLYGHSLGGAPTFELAGRAQRSALGPASLAGFVPFAVVGESAWCSIEAMIQDAAFLDLPRELLSRMRLDNCEDLAVLRGVPVMLLHGELDRVVPPRQLALLADGAAEPPIAHLVPGAAHVDVTVVGEPWDGSASVPRPSAVFAGWMLELAPPE
jgi:fermentation-respiration switch protein FrsA (DUF1100 family)